jgi:hypothetical protein
MYFFSITYLEVSMRFPVSRTLFVLVAALFLPTTSYGQEAKAKPTDEKTPTILFICEHGVAKSVIAAVLLRQTHEKHIHTNAALPAGADGQGATAGLFGTARRA